MPLSKICILSRGTIENLIKKEVVEHLTSGYFADNLTVEFEIAREELIKVIISTEVT